MMDLVAASLILFLILFAVDTFPAWHSSVKINKHFQTELERGFAEAKLSVPPFTHSEESE